MKFRFIRLIALGLLLTGCSTTATTSFENPGVNHVILLWLKQPENLKQAQQILQATSSLQQIPGVIKIRAGAPIASRRKIVDDSFDIGIHMLFANTRAMQEYVNHPDHIETVRRDIMPFVEKIVIYDFEG